MLFAIEHDLDVREFRPGLDCQRARERIGVALDVTNASAIATSSKDDVVGSLAGAIPEIDSADGLGAIPSIKAEVFDLVAVKPNLGFPISAVDVQVDLVLRAIRLS